MARPMLDAPPWQQGLAFLAKRSAPVAGPLREAIDAALVDAGSPLAVELQAACDHPTRGALLAAAERFKTASSDGPGEAKAQALEGMQQASSARVSHLREAFRQAAEPCCEDEDDCWALGQQGLDWAYPVAQAERRSVLGGYRPPRYGDGWPRCSSCGQPYRKRHLRAEHRGDGRCWRCLAESQGVVAPLGSDWMPQGTSDCRLALRRINGEAARLEVNKHRLLALGHEVMRLNA